MKALGGKDMGLDHPVDRHHCVASSPDLVCQRRYAERDAFAGKALGLPMEWLMLAVLVEHQHGEEAWAGPPARGDVERCRWLHDLLAVSASELLAHCLDDLPRARDHFERLGHILAESGQAVAAAGRARAWRGNDHALPRQVLGKRLADRLLALERGNGRRLRRGDLGGELVFRRIGFEILIPKLELGKQPFGALGTGPVLLAAQLGVTARVSWKISRCMLNARLASVILASARARPIVRTYRPIFAFWCANTCSTRARTLDLVALPRRTFSGIGRPLGFLRWMRLTRPCAFNQRSLLWLR